MQFALVDDELSEATAGARAACPQCLKEVIAKCGEINVHHWAHAVGDDCDPWSEPETSWHRRWKSFGHCVEVPFLGHRADIVTSTGHIVELQHSTITPDEIRAREACYGTRLRWLFDGTDLAVRMPDGDYVYAHRVIDQEDESWHYAKARLYLRWKNRARNVVTFRWKHPRKHYGATTCPTYVDLPDEAYVLKLGKLYLDGGPPYGGWGMLISRAQVERWLA